MSTTTDKLTMGLIYDVVQVLQAHGLDPDPVTVGGALSRIVDLEPAD